MCPGCLCQRGQAWQKAPVTHRCALLLMQDEVKPAGWIYLNTSFWGAGFAHGNAPSFLRAGFDPWELHKKWNAMSQPDRKYLNYKLQDDCIVFICTYDLVHLNWEHTFILTNHRQEVTAQCYVWVAISTLTWQTQKPSFTLLFRRMARPCEHQQPHSASWSSLSHLLLQIVHSVTSTSCWF